jgi:hypothetical protein
MRRAEVRILAPQPTFSELVLLCVLAALREMLLSPMSRALSGGSNPLPATNFQRTDPTLRLGGFAGNVALANEQSAERRFESSRRSHFRS